MKERKFKPCLTKQLLNMFKLRFERDLSIKFNKKNLKQRYRDFSPGRSRTDTINLLHRCSLTSGKAPIFSGGEGEVVRRLRISKIS